MSAFSRRLTLTTIGLALAAGTAATLAAIVSYKPAGVHDLQRTEYEAILQKIEMRDRLATVPKPVVRAVSASHPKSACRPGETVTSRYVVNNDGDAPLELSLSNAPSSRMTLREAVPLTVSPGNSVTLSFDWQVPDHEEELTDITASLKTNDPLFPKLPVAVSCRIAARFALAEEVLEVAQKFGSTGSARLFIYSQLYPDIAVSNVDADPRLVVDSEPELEESALISREATSGVWVTVTTPLAVQSGTTRTPIRLTVTSTEANDSEEIVVPFAWKVMPPFTFFSESLDARFGLGLGVIPLGATRTWTLFARSESFVSEDDLRVDVQPDALAVDVTRTRTGSNDFKVTIRLKSDAKPVDFQGANSGYVKLFLASNPDANSRLPLRGVVITPPRNAGL